MTRSLSDFTKKKTNDQPPLASSSTTKQGMNNRIGVTLRLQAEDWERIHYLAIQERTKIQSLLLEGLNEILLKRGLPPVNKP